MVCGLVVVGWKDIKNNGEEYGMEFHFLDVFLRVHVGRGNVDC